MFLEILRVNLSWKINGNLYKPLNAFYAGSVCNTILYLRDIREGGVHYENSFIGSFYYKLDNHLSNKRLMTCCMRFYIVL